MALDSAIARVEKILRCLVLVATATVAVEAGAIGLWAGMWERDLLAILVFLILYSCYIFRFELTRRLNR